MDLFKLAGKKALVVGGGLGIGRATARLLSGAGASVAVLDMDPARAETVAGELRSSGGGACAVSEDVSLPEGAEAAISKAAEGLDGLDILVNIVGRNSVTEGVADVTPEQFELLLSRNLRHHLYTSGAFARRQREAGIGGAVVMVASIAGILSAPGAGPYGATKAALISLTKTMAVEWAPLGIRVNSVAPGITWTDRNQWGQDIQDRAKRTIPMGRIGHQDEIARAALFLASDMASYITGQILVADGGMTIVAAYDGA